MHFAAATNLVFTYNRNVVFGATCYNTGTATSTSIQVNRHHPIVRFLLQLVILPKKIIFFIGLYVLLRNHLLAASKDSLRYSVNVASLNYTVTAFNMNGAFVFVLSGEIARQSLSRVAAALVPTNVPLWQAIKRKRILTYVNHLPDQQPMYGRSLLQLKLFPEPGLAVDSTGMVTE